MPPTKTSFPKQDIRILLLEGVSHSGIETFRAAGYSQIKIHTTSLPEEALQAEIAEAHIIGIRSRTQLNAAVLGHAKRLMAIGCFCIGTNQVDLDTAELSGIPVFNAPYSNTRSVAELIIAEAIFCYARSRRKMPNAIVGAGPNLPSTVMKHAVRCWASWDTVTSVRKSVCWRRRWGCR